MKEIAKKGCRGKWGSEMWFVPLGKITEKVIKDAAQFDLWPRKFSEPAPRHWYCGDVTLTCESWRGAWVCAKCARRNGLLW